MFGNGLRGEVWQEFVTRFNIKNISEFYGATEGNSNTGAETFDISQRKISG